MSFYPQPPPYQRDSPPLVSQSMPKPPSTRSPCRRYWLVGCFLSLLPLVIVCGLVGGVFLAAWRSGRLNVLILGLDRRPGETGPARTDTLILATFNPDPSQAALLSIPRDLWVDIPGQGANRINTANYFGDIAQPGYGPELARQTVQHNLGPPIHGYVLVDFSGFVALVDALGGIDVDVPQTIVDENYPTPDYGVMTIVIPAGPQHMDGATALIYARTRHADSDFDRSQRQQQVLRALVARTLQPGAWPRLPAAWAIARAYFTTTLNEVDFATILLAVLRVGPQGLQSYTINQDMTTPFTTDTGAQVLLPRWEMIWSLVGEIF
ncbi:MAG: LCP family protein [Chloroflexi bacterium]|nr:LCP family protein [Chloroflexota bacterium]